MDRSSREKCGRSTSRVVVCRQRASSWPVLEPMHSVKWNKSQAIFCCWLKMLPSKLFCSKHQAQWLTTIHHARLCCAFSFEQCAWESFAGMRSSRRIWQRGWQQRQQQSRTTGVFRVKSDTHKCRHIFGSKNKCCFGIKSCPPCEFKNKMNDEKKNEKCFVHSYIF